MKQLKYWKFNVSIFLCTTCTPVFSQLLPKASIGITAGQSTLRGSDVNGNGVVLGINYLTPIKKQPFYLNVGLSANYQDASNLLGPTYRIFYAINAEPSIAYLLSLRSDMAIRFNLGLSVQRLMGKSDPSDTPLTSQSFKKWRYGGLTKIGITVFPANKRFHIELCPISLRLMNDGHINNEFVATLGFPLKRQVRTSHQK